MTTPVQSSPARANPLVGFLWWLSLASPLILMWIFFYINHLLGQKHWANLPLGITSMCAVVGTGVYTVASVNRRYRILDR